MPIHHVGKRREALTRKGETYKEAVRAYMEVTGYGVKSDSSVEAHRPDQIYVPLAGGGLQDEVWVEAKDTHLSLSDKQFHDEMVHYLKSWLDRAQFQRFELKIFARSLSAPARWERVFGDTLDTEEVFDWIEGGQEGLLAKVLSPSDGRREDVPAFFASTTIVVGEREDLHWAAEERRKANTSVRSIEGLGQRIRQELEHCSKPIYKKSQFVAALYRMQVPRSYRVLAIDQLPTKTVYDRVGGGGRPPFHVLDRGRLLTVDVDGVENQFEAINAELAEVWTREEAEKINQDALLALLNGALHLLLYRRGMARDRGAYFFLADRQVAERKPRTIETPKGKLMVAKPYFLKATEPVGHHMPTLDKPGEIVEVAPEGGPHGPLYYVFHHGMFVASAHVWDDYYVQATPTRVFTRDGATPWPGETQARLDESFRAPEYNRSHDQLVRVEKILHHVFPTSPNSFGPPNWSRQLQFRGLVENAVPWSPLAPDAMQRRLLSFDQEVPKS